MNSTVEKASPLTLNEVLAEEPVILETYQKKRIYRFLKRTFDIVASAFFLLLLALPMLVIGIVIRLESEGPAIFRQERLGKNKKPFVCYKFRTMRLSAPHDCASGALDSPELYITPIGRFLRRASIDEVPQLLNVLKGDMSIIGPRPCIPGEVELTHARNQLGVYTIRPGITGLAQTNGRDWIEFDVKSRYDAEYIKNASVKLDLVLLGRTVKYVLKSEGIREGRQKK